MANLRLLAAGADRQQALQLAAAENVGRRRVSWACAARAWGRAPTYSFSTQTRAGGSATRQQEQRLLEATEALLAEGDPYADLRIEQITSRAGVSRTAFYQAFADEREPCAAARSASLLVLDPCDSLGALVNAPSGCS